MCVCDLCPFLTLTSSLIPYLHLLLTTLEGISRAGCEAFAKTLITMTALTNLDLSSNAVCCDGAIAIAEAVRSESCPLLRLNLSGNRIKVRGAAEVVRASISERSKLIYLSLTNNLIRKEGRDELASIAGYNYSNRCVYIYTYVYVPLSCNPHANSSPPRHLYYYYYYYYYNYYNTLYIYLTGASNASTSETSSRGHLPTSCTNGPSL